MSDLNPRKIQPQELIKYRPGGRASSLKFRDQSWETGTAINANDGLRLIYSAEGAGVVYVQSTVRNGQPREKGAFYIQTVQGFDLDVDKVGATAGLVSQNLAATRSVLSDFLDLYKGVLAVGGGPLAWSIGGMDMLATAGHVRRNYKTYNDAAVELVVARKFCRQNMPVLYRTVLETLFFGAFADQITKRLDEIVLEAAFPGKYKLAGDIVGVFVGKARGEPQFKRNLDLIKELMNEVILKVADHIVDNDASLSEQQVTDLAERHVCRILGRKGVPISDADAKTIVRETEASAISIRTMFRRLVKAIEISA